MKNVTLAGGDCLRMTDNLVEGQGHETADSYAQIVARLSEHWRVIACKDSLQWIAQRRKNGGAERPWRAGCYFRTRAALTRFCATSCGPVDPNAMATIAGLPSRLAVKHD